MRVNSRNRNVSNKRIQQMYLEDIKYDNDNAFGGTSESHISEKKMNCFLYQKYEVSTKKKYGVSIKRIEDVTCRESRY